MAEGENNSDFDGLTSTPRNHLGRMVEAVDKTWVRRLFFTVAFLAVALAPLTYIGNFAGDSQVHLIYGENVAQGGFFEFNPGENSPGVSSPGYMLLVGSFFKIAPVAWVPVVVKVVNILFWYGLSVVVFLIARRISASTVWAWIATAAAGLIPGSVYNSTIGMENGIFGFFVMFWLYLAIRNGWFTVGERGRISAGHELLLGLVAGVACWVRPEGFIVAAIALSYRALRSTGSRKLFLSSIGRSFVFLAPFLVISAGLGYFHYSQTDHLIPASGLSRILMSNISDDSFPVGPIFVSSRFTIRLLEYFPITVFAAFGSWLLVTGHTPISKGNRESLGFLIVLFAGAYVFYSAIIGSVHLSRYTIFVMPGLVLLALVGAKWLWEYTNTEMTAKLRLAAAFVMVGFAVVLGAVFVVETDRRLDLDSQASLWKMIQAPSERQAFSDALMDQLGTDADGDGPVILALQEVQIRYWLDDRFLIRSLDGRVDPILLDHATRVSVDHVGYLKERDIEFLLSLPNYNRDKDLWSLGSLRQLLPDESTELEGVRFSHIPIDRSSLTVPQEKSRWFEKATGPEVLNWFMENLIRVELPGTAQ